MDANVNLPHGYQLDAPQVPEGYTLDKEEQTSVPGAFGRGALDAIPFGMKGAAAVESGFGDKSYKDYLDELDRLVEADTQQHPIAHTTGEITGAVAPFAIPGVGEALGAESLLGRAGIGAGIGALQGASNTRADLTSPEGMKDIGLSAATGAVLNPAIGKVGDIISGGAGHLAPKLEEMANKKAVQSLNIAPGNLGVPSEDIQHMGSFARQLGGVEGSLEDRYNSIHDALQQTGKQIEDLGAGKTLAETQPFVNELHQHLQDSNAIYGISDNPEANLYRQGIANLQNPDGVPFETLQTFKNAAADRAFDKHGNITNQAAFNVYKTYSQAMEKLAEGHAEYPDLKKTYSVLKDMSGGLEGQLQREQASGIQAHGFGMAGKLGAMVTGGNVPATLAAAGALAPVHPFMAMGVGSTILTNPQVMSKMAGKGAEMMGNMASKSLPSAALTNVGEMAHHAGLHTSSEAVQNPSIPPQYAPVFQKNLQGIQDPAERQKQMTVTDFVLQSRDPNYSVAKKKQQEEF